MAAPKCVVCGTRVPVPMRASLQGYVHSQECAFVLLARIIEAVPGVVELLPPQWRGDLNANAELPETHSKVRRERSTLAFARQTNATLPPRLRLTDEQIDKAMADAGLISRVEPGGAG